MALNPKGGKSLRSIQRSTPGRTGPLSGAVKEYQPVQDKTSIADFTTTPDEEGQSKDIYGGSL